MRDWQHLDSDQPSVCRGERKGAPYDFRSIKLGGCILNPGRSHVGASDYIRVLAGQTLECGQVVLGGMENGFHCHIWHPQTTAD
ncbi:MAG: hypothetical protein COZ05_08165 [Armatimonadetes bacterium CG_4_10_14_3_um_filter_59_10]|nr:MAG: hypothetical protein COZ56_08470 [Armatimonadetes bacterium CG_4_8_14_3_um_filter_58_9]PIY44421.1 MAG: hypothetical protein COZ05_08165 [Armatimonadetes bacterium CG_4_10_14_3_um_filter_59_10]PJB62485.1 MAG: hypothetical protein CO095_18370 [Armatimonadetes bacterium CG_4_9_14_3_um_filter_58_7]